MIGLPLMRISEALLTIWTVTQVLYLASNTTGIPTAQLSTSPELDLKYAVSAYGHRNILTNLIRLPKWLSRLDLAAPCEGLAEYYVRNNEISCVFPHLEPLVSNSFKISGSPSRFIKRHTTSFCQPPLQVTLQQSQQQAHSLTSKLPHLIQQ